MGDVGDNDRTVAYDGACDDRIPMTPVTDPQAYSLLLRTLAAIPDDATYDVGR